MHCDDTGWHYRPRFVGKPKPTYAGMPTYCACTLPLNPLQPHRRGGLVAIHCSSQSHPRNATTTRPTR